MLILEAEDTQGGPEAGLAAREKKWTGQRKAAKGTGLLGKGHHGNCTMERDSRKPEKCLELKPTICKSKSIY